MNEHLTELKTERWQAKAYLDLDQEDLSILKEIWTQNLYRISPDRGKQVLDIGANKGLFSILCGVAGANVESYEPHPTTYAALVKNVELNNLTNRVKTHNFGISANAGVSTLVENVKTSGGNTLHPNNHPWVRSDSPTVSIQTVSFDSVIAQKEEWDIVKIDCEGSEYDIIESASLASFKKIRYITAEIHDWLGREAYDKLMGRLSQFFNVVGVDTDNAGQFNYIYATRR